MGGEHIPGSIFFVTVLGGAARAPPATCPQVLSEVSLGGEGKIRVYFSSTSSSEKTRRDINNLRTLPARPHGVCWPCALGLNTA